MPKPKTKSLNKHLYFAAGATIVIAVVCGVLTFTLNYRDQPEPPSLAERVSVGSMRYKLVNDKAVKRTDASVKELQAFLEREAARSGCTDQRLPFQRVVTYTQDETQAFIRYGCGAADSPIFAAKKDGVWRSLSPTNHFDMYNIPECTYVDENAISKDIAPVCVSDLAAAPPYTYSVR